MPVPKIVEPTQIRCTSISQPSRDSAYLSITRDNGTTEKFDLSLSHLKLFNFQTAKALADWPIEN